jgi:uncharacterized small protein (DUF1192 family)
MLPHIRHRQILNLFLKHPGGTYSFKRQEGAYSPIERHVSEHIAKVLPQLLDCIQSNDLIEHDCKFLLRDKHPLIMEALEHIERLSRLQNNIKFHFNQLIPSTHSKRLKSDYQRQKDALMKTVESALSLVKQRTATLTTQCATMSELCATYKIQERLAFLQEEALREEAERDRQQAEQERQRVELQRQETAQKMQAHVENLQGLERFRLEIENRATDVLCLRVAIPTTLAGLTGSAYLITKLSFGKQWYPAELTAFFGPCAYWVTATFIDLDNYARSPYFFPIHIATGLSTLLPALTTILLDRKALQG